MQPRRKIHEIHIVRGGNWSDAGQQPIDTAVEIVMGQYGRTGRKRLQQCCGGLQARSGKRMPLLRPRDRQGSVRDHFWSDCRFAYSRTLARSYAILHVGRCMIDRRNHGSGQRVRFLTDMDRTCCKTGLIARRVSGQFSVFLKLVCRARIACQLLTGFIIWFSRSIGHISLR